MPQLSEAQIRDAFEMYDTDGSGTVSADELSQAMRTLGM